MSPQRPRRPIPGDDVLLTPREAAEILGCTVSTIAVWARAGKLEAHRTPGGHRRYRSADVRKALDDAQRPKTETEENRARIQDALRLYDEGWSIRQVARQFECSYGAMRRLLLRNGRLRTRTGPRP